MRKPSLSATVFATGLYMALAAGICFVYADDVKPFGCRGTIAMTTTCSNVATAQKDAIYKISGEAADSEALEVIARPIAVDAASAYLVQVFVDPAPTADDPTPKFLGSFSFFPARVGQSQTFVLPKPQPSTSAKELNLSIKLVAANASKTLKNSAVEIIGARLVK